MDAGDFDNDGDEDLIVANLAREYAALYVNENGWFEDKSHERGVLTPTVPYTGFGAGFVDYDNDGWLDILIVNGAVTTIESLARAGNRYPLGQAKLLLRNRGTATFVDVSQKAGSVFGLLEVSRGAAFGDVDNDGDTDVLIVNNNGPARASREYRWGAEAVGWVADAGKPRFETCSEQELGCSVQMVPRCGAECIPTVVTPRRMIPACCSD